MIKQYVLVIGVSAFLTTINDANANPYLEQDGRLIVEVEAGSAGGNWKMQNLIAGHTGAGYLVWDGPNNYGKSEAPRGNPNIYKFRVTKPGNYQLNWRSRNTVSTDATEHNDSWVRFPTGKNIDGQHSLDGWTKAYMGQVQQWTWDAYTVDHDNQPIRQFFNAGDHVIEIAGRSNGHGLDRFALFQYEEEDFNTGVFESLPQSPRLSVAGVATHASSANTCDANVLSLSSDTAMLSSGSNINIAGGDIRIEGQQNAILRFNAPQMSSDKVTLKLSSNQPSLALSAYLGSHNDWNSSTTVENLPDASTLLGTVNVGNSKDQIVDLSIDGSLLPANQVTIILRTESANAQQLHGLATDLEPRLNIEVSENFCLNYQDTDGTDDKDGADKPDQPEPNVPATPDVPEAVETPDVPTTTDPVQENNPGSAPLLVVEPETSDTQSPFEVVDASTSDNGGETVATRKRGGAVSGWFLVLMAMTGMIARLRKPSLVRHS